MHAVRQKITNLHHKVSTHGQPHETLVKHLRKALQEQLESQSAFYGILNEILSSFNTSIHQDGDPFGIETALGIVRASESLDSMLTGNPTITATDCQLECYVMLIALSQTDAELLTRWRSLKNFLKQATFNNPTIKEQLAGPVLALTWHGTSLLEEAIELDNLYLIQYVTEHLLDTPDSLTSASMIKALNNALKLAIKKIKAHPEQNDELKLLIDKVLLIHEQRADIPLEIEVLSSILILKIKDKKPNWALWERIRPHLSTLNEETRAELLLYASQQNKMNVVELFVQSNDDILCHNDNALTSALLCTAAHSRSDLVQTLLVKRPDLRNNRNSYDGAFKKTLEKGSYRTAFLLWTRHIDNNRFIDIFTPFLTLHLFAKHKPIDISPLRPFLAQFFFCASEEQKKLVLLAACQFEQWAVVNYMLMKQPGVILNVDFNSLARAPSEQKEQFLLTYLKCLYDPQLSTPFTQAPSSPLIGSSAPTSLDEPISSGPTRSVGTSDGTTARLELASLIQRKDSPIPIIAGAAGRALRRHAELQELTKEQLKQIIEDSLVAKEANTEVLDKWKTARAIAKLITTRERWDKVSEIVNHLDGKFKELKRDIKVQELQVAPGRHQPLLETITNALWAQLHPVKINAASTDLDKIKQGIEHVILHLHASNPQEISSRLAARLCPNRAAIQLHITSKIEQALKHHQSANPFFEYKSIPYPDILLQQIQNVLIALNADSLRFTTVMPVPPRSSSTPPRTIVADTSSSIYSVEHTVSPSSFFQPNTSVSKRESVASTIEQDRKVLHSALQGFGDASFHRRSVTTLEQILPVALCFCKNKECYWNNDANALDDYIKRRQSGDKDLSLESILSQFATTDRGKHRSFFKDFIVKLAQEIRAIDVTDSRQIMEVIRRLSENPNQLSVEGPRLF